MGFGLGLGSFVDGMSKGLDIAGRLKEQKRASERFDLEKQQVQGSLADQAYARDRRIVEDGQQDATFAESRADRSYARDRAQLTDSRSDAEFARAEDKRSALEGVATETGNAFNKAVKDGTADPNQFTEFWTKYALPKQKAILLQKGDTAGAAELEKWGMSQDAIKGGNLFASAMLKAQTGDPAGALQDAIAAGKVGGYIKSGYEVAGQQEMKDPAGNLLGYRLTLRDQGGKEINQDIAVGDVGRVISTFLNPEVAWQSQAAAQADAAKTQTELAVYDAKKAIDAKYDGASGLGVKGRADAIKQLRERYTGLGGAEDKIAFDSMTRPEQERLIQQELALQSGQQATGLGPQVLFDTQNGKVVGGGPEQPVEKSSRYRPPAAADQEKPADRLPAGDPAAQPATADAERSALLDMVPKLLADGTPPEEVAARLARAGIKVNNWRLDQWPDTMRVLARQYYRS